MNHLLVITLKIMGGQILGYNRWNDDCQIAFDKIKEYLLEPPILMPPVEGRPLIMYLTVLENSMGCVLGQHDESG